MKSMSARHGEYSLACMDYAGYDTQISLIEYLKISLLLNHHRSKNPDINSLLCWFAN